MLTKETPAGPIQFFDSIHELPARRYAAFQRVYCDFLGIGSDMRASEGHRARLASFLEGEDLDSIRREFNNYLLNIGQMERGAHLGAEALATLVHSIGGAVVDAPANRDYKPIAEQLLDTGITQEQVEEALEEIAGKFLRR